MQAWISGLLDAFADFRVYGTQEERGPDRRRVVYDLAAVAPTADVDAITSGVDSTGDFRPSV